MGLSRRQKLALNRSNATVNLWYGSVRSSKTYAQLWDFIARMSTATGQGTNLLVGHSTNTVWRNFFLPLVSRPEFAAIAPHLRYRQNAPTGTLFGKPFSVVGASNEASWISIQGLTVENAWGDEAAAWPQSFWDMLLSRLSLPQSRLLVTCNPDTANHYLKTQVVDKADVDPDIHVERFLLEENPTLEPEYIARLKRQYSGLFYKRMIQAMWVAAEGAVYETWDPETMVGGGEVETILAVGIDYGTNHPTAGYAIGIDEAGTLVCTDEWAPNLATGVHTRLTDSQLADSLQEWLGTLPTPPQFIYCDPAAASFREELKQRRVQTVKASNQVLDGIRTVDSALNNGTLMISPNCTRLIDGLAAYRWDPKATRDGRDAPVKEHDDEVDALRYAVHSSRHIWRRLTTPAGVLHTS